MRLISWWRQTLEDVEWWKASSGCFMFVSCLFHVCFIFPTVHEISTINIHKPYTRPSYLFRLTAIASVSYGGRWPCRICLSHDCCTVCFYVCGFEDTLFVVLMWRFPKIGLPPVLIHSRLGFSHDINPHISPKSPASKLRSFGGTEPRRNMPLDAPQSTKKKLEGQNPGLDVLKIKPESLGFFWGYQLKDSADILVEVE